jgi:hypothetical protein
MPPFLRKKNREENCSGADMLGCYNNLNIDIAWSRFKENQLSPQWGCGL